ncbi:MAG: hypothetical protein IT373_00245, partial [Polyangiaceae bacterium]|nr:hypothetical protein [Polyangiaceae bacterium]
SLGGYVGIETYLRRPEAFGAWGSVQGALGGYRIPEYVEKLRAVEQRLGPRPIHLETSTFDDFVDTNRAFAKALTDAGIRCELRVGQGPHDQPFLREAGSLEMLLWHDRLG